MRCACKNCINNEDGYCAISSYVQIEQDGTCSEIDVREEGKDE